MAGEEDRFREGEEDEAQQDITEDKNSMSYMLAHTNEEPDVAPAGPEAEAAAPETEETPEAKAAREAADEEAAIAARSAQPEGSPENKEDEEPAPDSPEGRLKAAQTKMHEATEEAAREKEARAALQAELDALKAVKPAEPQPATQTLSEDDREAKILEIETAIRAKEIEDLRNLDVGDFDYTQQYAAIVIKARREIKKAIKAAGLDEQPKGFTQEEMAKAFDERYKANQEAAEIAKAEADKKTAAERAWERALDQGEKAGLQVRDKKTADSIVYHALEQELPEELYGKPEEATQWLITETRARLGRVAEQSEAEKAAALANQRQNDVMGKGGSPPPKTPTTRPTFSEMINEVSP